MRLHLLKKAGISLHVVATGGASDLQHELWKIPGASAFLSGCSFPYSKNEEEDLIGFFPEHSVCEETAIDLACAAFMKAYRFDGKAPVGIGLTAAVASDRKRRSKDQCFVCGISESGVVILHQEFPGGDRAVQGDKCVALGFWALELLMEHRHLHTAANTDRARARFMQRPLFDDLGRRSAPLIAHPFALMPGAFNPPHRAHFEIADEVRSVHRYPVVFQITADPPHKDPLTLQDMLKRAKLLRGRPVLFTEGHPFYIDKARERPEVPIVMGADALLRLFDPKWGLDPKATLCEFSSLGTMFYVAPRTVDGKKLTVDDCFAIAGIDCEFRGMFTELETFANASSTAIRAGKFL